MRRAQTYTLDFILAMGMVVVVGVIAVSMLLVRAPPPSPMADGQTLAGILFSPYPEDWTESDVIFPGFVVRHRFNESLFAMFASLVPPEKVRDLSGISSFFFVNVTDGGVLIGEAGDPVAGSADPFVPSLSSAQHVSVVRRYAAHGGAIVLVEVYTWV